MRFSLIYPHKSILRVSKIHMNKKDLDKEFEYIDVEDWENSDSNERYGIWKLRRDFNTKISVVVIMMAIGFIFLISQLPPL